MPTLTDDRGLPLSTASPQARDAYVEGVRRLLCALPGIETALQDAIEADPSLALAHVALARTHQVHARGAQARACLAAALDCLDRANERERSHVRALEPVLLGDAATALKRIREHLAQWPRDAMVMAPTAGVFGLFGFSGLAAREQALIEFLDPFAPDCGDDWWFQYAHAFAQCEVGQLDAARANVERALAAQPRSANAAHIATHVRYECGEHAEALQWLHAWHQDYDRAGFMHGHLGWHLALSALELGQLDRAWAFYDEHAGLGAAWGPPLNLLTDSASFLMRAELLGGTPQPERWQALARYTDQTFPQTGVAFADAHAAIVYAMAGEAQGLARIRDEARGPAADVVSAIARGFGALARGQHAVALSELEPLMASHERIGGSRAQRDLVGYAVLRARQPHAARLGSPRAAHA